MQAFAVNLLSGLTAIGGLVRINEHASLDNSRVPLLILSAKLQVHILGLLVIML